MNNPVSSSRNLLMIDKLEQQGYMYFKNCVNRGVCSTILIKSSLAQYSYNQDTYQQDGELDNSIYSGRFGCYRYYFVETRRLISISLAINEAMNIEPNSVFWKWRKDRIKLIYIPENGCLLAQKDCKESQCEEFNNYYAFVGLSNRPADYTRGDFYINSDFKVCGKKVVQNSESRKYFDLNQGDVLIVNACKFIAGTRKLASGTIGHSREICKLKAVELNGSS